jgi:hypothetical protein
LQRFHLKLNIMENTESKLSPEESLLIIRQTIEVAKRRVQENGFHLLLWGALVVVAGLIDFYCTWHAYPNYANQAWAVMPLIGLPVALIYEIRRSRRQVERNIVNQWYGLIWLGYGITMAMLITYAVKNELPPTPLILAVTGFAIFISGHVLAFRPLVWGSVVIWAGAFLCFFQHPLWHSLTTAVCIGLGYLIPGYLLNRSKRA